MIDRTQIAAASGARKGRDAGKWQSHPRVSCDRASLRCRRWGLRVARLTIAPSTVAQRIADSSLLRAIGKLADSAMTYVRKGSRSRSSDSARRCDREAGVRQYTTDILINEMQFLDRPQGVGGASTEGDADELLDEEPVF